MYVVITMCGNQERERAPPHLKLHLMQPAAPCCTCTCIAPATAYYYYTVQHMVVVLPLLLLHTWAVQYAVYCPAVVVGRGKRYHT